MSDERVFKSEDSSGKEVELRFVRPSQKIISKGDFVYREHFGKSVRAGLMTSAEADKLLKDRNIWNSEREEEALEIQLRISELEEDIKKPDLDANEGMRIYRDIKQLRSELDGITSIRRSIVDNTAEAVAAEMRTQFYASECVVYNHNGRRVFKNLQDFTERLTEKIALDSYRQALICNYETVFGIDLSSANHEDSRSEEDKWFDSIRQQDTEESESDTKESSVKLEKKPRKRQVRKKKKTESEE